MLCMHQYSPWPYWFSVLWYGELQQGYHDYGHLRNILSFQFKARLQLLLISPPISWLSPNNLQKTAVVALLAGNVHASRLTRDWEKALKSSALHPPNIPKTNLTPGCQKTQHYCHTTRRKLESSSCETQPLEACHTCPDSCLVPSVGWSNSDTERNQHLCKIKVVSSVTADLLLPLSNYTFTSRAGKDVTKQSCSQSQIYFIWDFAQ